ncbi:MAG: hypothetical protein CO158_04645 [Piscirickettsiaceae bacterium CG_4_9_14_3_um_filter_43_564]|nr:hypothetical protein [Thiomicrospira sp.]NCN67340.1 hypothetical protein [Thiomicrospira sp.]NCO13580.1 hypothetical protein [Thiomicrospira sp.]PJA66144.1 MAG: hypothetical protein CO158_04645 [Piscirickettsiaceae bacterium CG_4_9_14_3_um_filter_43_564]
MKFTDAAVEKLIEAFQQEAKVIVLEAEIVTNFQPVNKLKGGIEYIDGQDVKALNQYPSLKKVDCIFKKLIANFKLPGIKEKYQKGDIGVNYQEIDGEQKAIVMFYVKDIGNGEMFDNIYQLYVDAKESEFKLIKKLRETLSKPECNREQVGSLVDHSKLFSDAKGFQKLFLLGFLDDKEGQLIFEKDVIALKQVIEENDFDTSQEKYEARVVGIKNTDYVLELIDHQQETTTVVIPGIIGAEDYAMLLFCAFYKGEEYIFKIAVSPNTDKLDGFGVDTINITPISMFFPSLSEVDEVLEYIKEERLSRQKSLAV